MELDKKDRLLLTLLQNDAKQTTKNLSLQLDLSVTAVFERVKRLERNGVIKSYVAVLDPKKLEKDFAVLCHVKLLQHSKEYITTFERQIVELPEVMECFHVSGDYDYILKIVVGSMEEYREFMVSKLTTLEHIASTHSSFTIKEVKREFAFAL